jgi:hypothetical protein
LTSEQRVRVQGCLPPFEIAVLAILDPFNLFEADVFMDNEKMESKVPSSGRVVYQPLHASMREKLDPEYVKIHDEILQYVERSETQAWDPASRSKPSPTAHASQKTVPVGSISDLDMGDYQTRTFVPAGEPPAGGWPLLVWVRNIGGR